jgi:hypothetical protein
LAPTTGTAATITDSKAGAHDVLVTITQTASGNNTGFACYMSFDASGGLTQSASNDFSVSFESAVTNLVYSGSSSFLVSVTGSTTFTAKFKGTANNRTCSWTSNRITIQVF